MTRESVPLPGLRALTTAFFLARIAEGKAYCADLDNKVVQYDSCASNIEQSADTFFMFSSDDQNISLGSTIDPSKTDLFDSSDPVERQNVLLPLDMESGGFGKRQDGCGGGGSGSGGGSSGGGGGNTGGMVGG
ncbi:hypothetical protein KVR01_011769 [Diaporthe batatas]|uniref:uncharacterized protein n=1 Tax=Diaporthe batatas TaxID=748121 RepID=UPI001D0408EB|nr:uncharacterized protein KVR01_011769 [Diaporthe batatas]KAG8158647.1 hypothetical protein KVR01_011769 [Diaporthe batatas]